MKMYEDFVEKYPSNVVEMLRKGYAQTTNPSVCRIQTLERNNYYIQKQFVELLSLLNACENLLNDLDESEFVRGKASVLNTTRENKVVIEKCCNNPCNLDTFYYATGRPSCSPPCRRSYCECEWRVINKLLFLMTIKNLPIDQLILFDLLKCRMCVLQEVGYKID